ncbi:MAG: ribonuclease R [Candidatus Aminicenantes bacterium]|nr:ribonuclease R [Candidatus Aminicenantes bacterium]
MDERIISLLKKKREGLSFQKLIKELSLSSRQRQQLRKRLKVLEGKGILRRYKSRYFIPAKSNLVVGRFISSFGGYGFVSPEGKLEEDIFIPARFSGKALQGDLVEVFYREKGKKGKPEGRVLRIIKKSKAKIIGVYDERFSQPFFLPLDSPQAQEVPLASKESFSPLPGMIVEVDRETRRLTGIYGMPEEPGVDTRVVIERHGLRSSFSEGAAEEARDVPVEVSPEEIKGRVDYRSWKTVTIDGEKAQDFDDAVSIKKLKQGHFLLGVHIADVSHYIKPDTSLDKEALQRGTSVYFPDLTLPMLPEVLSNNICSLRPKQVRLTCSVLLEIDKNGEILKSEFHPSVIQTAERMTYNSVYKIFEGDKKERQRYAHLVPDFLLMKELARVLRRKRKAEGSLDFDLVEPELVYKEEKLHSVEPFKANEAHQVIEEFMVLANEAVATYLGQKKIPLIYRVHPRPALQDLDRLRTMLLHFGISFPRAKDAESYDLQRAIKSAEGKPEEKFINLQVLKSLKLAVYTEERLGHYGLAKKEYTHFTSPIRRYPDLVVHRILKNALKKDKAEMPELSSVALHSSHQEREAEAAEKELIEWRILRLLQEKLGEELEGIIVGISRAGLAVELDNYFVDGLISYADLKNDYYSRKSDKTIVGRRTGEKYELGDRVKVILASVNPLLRRINLTLSQGN